MYKPFLLLLAVPATAFGDVTLPPLISDNMLLQQANAAVWGKADPGETVKVTLGQVTASGTADKDGAWRVMLGGLRPAATGEMTIEGTNKLTVRNVAVGDVWVCSGQSNMEMTVEGLHWNPSGVLNHAQEIATADFPGIRMFIVPKTASETPVGEVAGKWEVCSPGVLAHWSATGYFFGRQLHRDLGVPIGLIHSSWGGTPAQAWTPTDTLQGDPDFKATYYTPRQEQLAKYPAARERYEKEVLPKWQAASEAAKAEGKPLPAKPKPPVGPGGGPAASTLYNAMIAGAAKYSIKGAVWYQGEANANDPLRYHRLLPAMIGSWRKAWNQGDFPFYIVQLAAFQKPAIQPENSTWANLRESQLLTSNEIPNSGLAVTIDIGEAGIHPANKQEVGRRLALVAEAKTYGKNITFSGPAFDAVRFEGAQAAITFKSGTADGLATSDKGPIKGFAIAGEDRKFVWADARFGTGGSNVVVSSPEVPKPVAVRYAWATYPIVNLVNKAGLPAGPFRTDDWPSADKPVKR